MVSFFEERRGRLCGFRFGDPFDWKLGLPSAQLDSGDCVIGSGDGESDAFQLVKIYGTGADRLCPNHRQASGGLRARRRRGTEFTTGFAVDDTTGLVTFEVGSVSAAGVEVTAGFAFDVPTRFDTDRLDVSMSHFAVGAIPQVPIVEVLP